MTDAVRARPEFQTTQHRQSYINGIKKVNTQESLKLTDHEEIREKCHDKECHDESDILWQILGREKVSPWATGIISIIDVDVVRGPESSSYPQRRETE